MKNGILAASAIILSIILSVISGCAPKGYAEYYSDLEEMAGVMLVDYYCKKSSTVCGNGHFEMVLSTAESEREVRLDVYNKEEDSEESCVSYLVPCEAAERCYEVITKYGMNKWNGMKNAVSLDGVLEVCKFRYGEEYLRVTTEEMPYNGEEAMAAIREIMSEYALTQYLISE